MTTQMMIPKGRIAVAGGTGTVGRYVVDSAKERGHQAVILSRSHGVDLRSGEGLERALEGVDAIIDVTNAGSTEREAATRFFTEVAGRLQAVGATCGVKHILTLSIVGIDRAPDNGYYASVDLLSRCAVADDLHRLRWSKYPVFDLKQSASGTPTLESWSLDNAKPQVCDTR